MDNNLFWQVFIYQLLCVCVFWTNMISLYIWKRLVCWTIWNFFFVWNKINDQSFAIWCWTTINKRKIMKRKKINSKDHVDDDDQFDNNDDYQQTFTEPKKKKKWIEWMNVMSIFFGCFFRTHTHKHTYYWSSILVSLFFIQKKL